MRKIAFALEDLPEGVYGYNLEFEGYTPVIVGHHVLLMREAGLVEASLVDGIGALPERLTWAGHEFVEAARDDTLWNKAKTQVMEKAGGVTIGLLVEYLKHPGRQQLGLA